MLEHSVTPFVSRALERVACGGPSETLERTVTTRGRGTRRRRTATSPRTSSGISARVRSSTPSGARVRLPGGQSETVEDTGCAVRFSVSRRIGCCGLRAPLSLPGCAPKGLCASGFRFASSLARVGPSFVRAIAGLRAAHRSLREGDRWDCARRSARFARAIDLGLHARVRELSGRPGLQGDCVRQSVRLASAINWACMRAFESTPADLAFPS